MNIYVSNLGRKITDESLRATFATYGEVGAYQIMVDGFTGNSRGVALIEMPNDQEAAIAIEKMDGSIIDGQMISVQKARPGNNIWKVGL